MSGIFSVFKITASALTAQRLRMDLIASNVANAETTRGANGAPYQRQLAVFAADPPRFNLLGRVEEPGRGVRVQQIVTDETPGQRVYDPDHPDADENGYVTYPNVNLATEMTDMLSATRAYEANVTVFNALKSMALRALDIGKA
jgi:flagellar basal-body rod protein FlgC